SVIYLSSGSFVCFVFFALCFFAIPRPPCPSLFPYATLFRSLRRHDAPQLFAMVEQLSRRAELPMPRLYIIESQQPNAFATGRGPDRKSTRLNSSHVKISYAVFCLKKKTDCSSI